ncbi:MAG: tetratricopeptide (TPR) repeat protein [Myxococcota bacterium]|jgi:tetratricopeptide (TPR) repeat protein
MNEPDNAVSVLVFLDIAGASRLWARDPDTMRQAMEVYDSVLQGRLSVFDGPPLRRLGTGSLLAWDSPIRAVQFCLSVQEGLAKAMWPPALLEQPEASVALGVSGAPLMAGLRTRIGVHRGNVWPSETGVLDGASVRRVVRVTRAGHGGQILATKDVQVAVAALTGGDLTMRPLGGRPLRGVPGSVALFDVRSPGLAARAFPPPRTRDVERTNHLAESNAFVGRTADLDAVAELLDFGVRSIVITAPPGMGRRRLVSALLDQLPGRWTGDTGGGMWVVDCPSVRDLDDFLCVIAGAVDMDLSSQSSAHDAVQQLTRWFADRGPVLLVIRGLAVWDAEIRAAVTAWLRRVPTVQVVGTADARVGLEGEIQYRLGPLPTSAGGLRSPSARLLIRRVRERAGTVTPDDHEAIRGLVNATGGVPLALELLSGQVGTRSLSALAEELSVTGHQATTGEVLNACLAQLPAWMRGMLQRLSVIEGAFATDTAEAVTALREWVAAPTISDALALLCERGLIGPVRATDDIVVAEYVLHSLVRAHLRDSGAELELVAAEDRYAKHAITSAKPWMTEINGPFSAEALAVLARRRRMLLAALEIGMLRSVRDPTAVQLALDALLALDAVSMRQGLPDAHEARLDRAIAAAAESGIESVALIRCLCARARVRYLRSGLDGARTDLERARDLGRQLEDPEGEGIALGSLGQLLAGGGRLPEAIELLGLALQRLISVDAPRETASVRAALGSILTQSGDPRGAEEHLAAAVLGFRAGHDAHNEALALVKLGIARRRLGKLAAARGDLEAALAAHIHSGSTRREAVAREQLGAVAAQQRRLPEAKALLASARELARSSGERRVLGRISCRMGMVLVEQAEPIAAREAFNEALALAADTQSASVQALAHAGLGILHHEGGRSERSLDHYRRAVACLHSGGEPRVQTATMALAAACHAEQGQLEEARRLLHVTLARMAEVGDQWVDCIGAVARAWVDAESTNWSEGATARLRTTVASLDGREDVPIVVRALFRVANSRLRWIAISAVSKSNAPM